MTDLFSDIKAKSITSPLPAEAEQATKPHLTPGIKAEAGNNLPKRGRGRPKKEGTTHPSKTPEEKHHDQGKSDKVTYLSRETKALLQKVKAMMLISTGQSLDESAIVAIALDCFIDHNKLRIE